MDVHQVSIPTVSVLPYRAMVRRNVGLHWKPRWGHLRPRCAWRSCHTSSMRKLSGFYMPYPAVQLTTVVLRPNSNSFPKVSKNGCLTVLIPDVSLFQQL